MFQEIMERESRIGEMKSLSVVFILAALLVLLAHNLGGFPVSIAALAAGIVSWFLTPQVTPSVILHFYRGYRAHPHRHAKLYTLIEELAHRAGLKNVPELWILPSFKPIAFATGDVKSSAIALSEGILDKLNPHELAGVMAHEMSHVVNRDNRMMWFSVVTVKIIQFLSVIGQLMVVVHLPALIRGEKSVSLMLLTVVVVAPIAATLLQLALLRTREFAADTGSARIMGSAEPLMRALRKLEVGMATNGMMCLTRRRKEQKGHTLFRTHPPVKDRLKRLMVLSGVGAHQMALMPEEPKKYKSNLLYLAGSVRRPPKK